MQIGASKTSKNEASYEALCVGFLADTMRKANAAVSHRAPVIITMQKGLHGRSDCAKWTRVTTKKSSAKMSAAATDGQ
jgi:hypothetical protein